MQKKAHIIIETYDNKSFIYAIINKDSILEYYEDIGDDNIFEERLKEIVGWNVSELKNKLEKDKFIYCADLEIIISSKEIKKVYCLYINDKE